jgi:hypothetical protein
VLHHFASPTSFIEQWTGSYAWKSKVSAGGPAPPPLARVHWPHGHAVQVWVAKTPRASPRVKGHGSCACSGTCVSQPPGRSESWSCEDCCTWISHSGDHRPSTRCEFGSTTVGAMGGSPGTSATRSPLRLLLLGRACLRQPALAPIRTSGAPRRAASAVWSLGCSCDSRSAATRAR